MSATVHQGSAWRRGGLAQLTGLREEGRRKGKEVLILSAARCVQSFSTGNLKIFKYFYHHLGLDLWQTVGSHDNQIKDPEGFLSYPHNMHSECLC